MTFSSTTPAPGFCATSLRQKESSLTLATNHLGHFVLTLSLLDLLERSAEARIINVASGAHYGADGVIENILRPEEYDGKKQYARSKLANVLFTYALAERLKDRQSRITVNAADPGGVATNFARNNGLIPWLKHRLYYLSKRQPQPGPRCGNCGLPGFIARGQRRYG